MIRKANRPCSNPRLIQPTEAQRVARSVFGGTELVIQELTRRLQNERVDLGRFTLVLWDAADPAGVISFSPAGGPRLLRFAAWRRGVSVEQLYRASLDGSFDEGLPNVWGLFRLVVAERYRRQGIGSALTRSVSDWCAGVGAEWVLASVESENVAAQKIFERAGWRRFEVDVPQDGLVDYVKRLEIVQP